MKKTLLFSVLFLLLLTSCKNKRNTVIEGTLSSGARKYLYLDYLDIDKTTKVDSLKIKKDDNFKFRIHLDEPGIYILRNENGKLINLLPSPGEHLTIQANYAEMNRDYSVSGSKESEYIRQLVEKIYNTRDRLSKLDEMYDSLSNVTQDQASDYI
ncbi:MAG TPA: DUF4369 domain-containing protein, partial [Bacteroidales bacterium]|nr:DUF4369 domain-containing protein [Bacteroidales bacterium]